MQKNEPKSKTVQVKVLICLACRDSKKTLYKLGDFRICKDCRNKLMKYKKLQLQSGGYIETDDKMNVFYTPAKEENMEEKESE